MAFTKSGDTASASFYLDSLKGFVFFGDYSNRLHCFNIYTGDKVWQTQSYSPDYLNNMPTVAGSIVYVNGDVSGLFAFDLKTGAKLWNTKLPSSSGFVSTRQNPLYLNNKIYQVAQKGFYIINASTGVIESNNQFPLPSGFNINPVIDNSLLFTAATASSSTVYAFNVNTGDKVWEYNVATQLCENPVVNNNLLIFSGNNGKIYALNQQNGTLAWSKDFSVNFNNFGSEVSPVIYNDKVIVYSGNSGYYALYATTGATIWNSSAANGPSTSPPAVGNGNIYFTTLTSGKTNVIAIDANTGKLKWEKILNQPITISTPIFCKNKLYLGNNRVWGYGMLVYLIS